MSSADPERLAARVTEFLGRDPDRDRSIALDEGRISFAEGAASSRDRLTGTDMTATDRGRLRETYEFARTVVQLV